MSDRQIAYAMMDGRTLTFRFFNSQPAHEISGYVVASDDYHWMIASVRADPADDGDLISCSLIHKSQAPVITINSRSTFEEEEINVQIALYSLGGSYWDWAANTYYGKARANVSNPTTQGA